jgi:hypothetical protein
MLLFQCFLSHYTQTSLLDKGPERADHGLINYTDISLVDPDPQHFGNLDPDPQKGDKSDPNQIKIMIRTASNKNQDPDPHPDQQQSVKVISQIWINVRESVKSGAV